MKGPAKWAYFYLYVIFDVFSRYVVGWMVAYREAAALAEKLIESVCKREGIEKGKLTIHADRGSSMTSKPVALLLSDLGVTKSHNRPHLLNDNPIDFFKWYNTMHHHDGLGLLTPYDVHYGFAATRLAEREAVLRKAFEAMPERFVRGVPKPPAFSRERPAWRTRHHPHPWRKNPARQPRLRIRRESPKLAAGSSPNNGNFKYEFRRSDEFRCRNNLFSPGGDPVGNKKVFPSPRNGTNRGADILQRESWSSPPRIQRGRIKKVRAEIGGRLVAFVVFTLATTAAGGAWAEGGNVPREIPLLAGTGAATWVRITGEDKKTARLFVATIPGGAAASTGAARPGGAGALFAECGPARAYAVEQEIAIVVSAVAGGEISARNARRDAKLLGERIRRIAAARDRKNGTGPDACAEAKYWPAKQPDPIFALIETGLASETAKEAGEEPAPGPLSRPETNGACGNCTVNPPLARPGG